MKSTKLTPIYLHIFSAPIIIFATLMTKIHNNLVFVEYGAVICSIIIALIWLTLLIRGLLPIVGLSILQGVFMAINSERARFFSGLIGLLIGFIVGLLIILIPFALITAPLVGYIGLSIWAMGGAVNITLYYISAILIIVSFLISIFVKFELFFE